MSFLLRSSSKVDSQEEVKARFGLGSKGFSLKSRSGFGSKGFSSKIGLDTLGVCKLF